MLDRCQTRICSSRSASGLQTFTAPFHRPRSSFFVAAVTSKVSPDKQRIQVLQAQSLQLAPQQQTQQLASSNLSNRPATNGVHRSNKRLKVAVDVDEGAPPLPSKILALDCLKKDRRRAFGDLQCSDGSCTASTSTAWRLTD